MSKRVFRVRFQLKWDDSKEWMDDETTTVLAVDAEQAIVACRKRQMKETASYPDTDGGPDVRHKVEGFRLIGVEPLVAVDIESARA